MNPPYNGNLHLKILRTVIEQCNGAEIVNLSPNFYRDYKKLDGVPVAADIEEIDIFSASSLFEGIKLSFPLAIQHYVSGKEDKSLLTKYIPATYNIYKRLKYPKTFKDVNKLDYSGEKYFVPLMLMRMVNVGYKEDCIIHPKFKLIEDGLCNGKPWKEIRPSASGTNPDRPCGGIPFDTKEEAENFIAYNETKFFKALVGCMHTNSRYILSEYPFMPTYKHPWTDAELYKYFALTDEEIKEIEKCIL
jgi:hypothetical protein